MEIRKYLDSTYLKTTEQSGLSEEETRKIVHALAKEAMDLGIYAVMIRPQYVSEIRKYLDLHHSNVVLGTVIGFPEGTQTTDSKLNEAKKAIDDGADELDFVINYEAFKNGSIEDVKDEFLLCTRAVIEQQKVIKWIIEIAALNNEEVARITDLIRIWSEENFSKELQEKIFVKSSTGFFKTQDGKPNGATVEGIQIMLKHAGNLPVKAAGGVRSKEDAIQMIKLGVKRIGTSSAKDLLG